MQIIFHTLQTVCKHIFIHYRYPWQYILYVNNVAYNTNCMQIYFHTLRNSGQICHCMQLILQLSLILSILAYKSIYFLLCKLLSFHFKEYLLKFFCLICTYIFVHKLIFYFIDQLFIKCLIIHPYIHHHYLNHHQLDTCSDCSFDIQMK